VTTGGLLGPGVPLPGELRLMASAGVGSLRAPFYWRELQRAKGPVDFSVTDPLVLAAAQAHVAVLPVVLGAPRWAARHPSMGNSPPQGTASYAALLRALARRYGSDGSLWREHPAVPRTPIRDWQVWNEPNLSDYFTVQPFAKPYVRLLRAARTAIRQADPGARVVMAGLANFSWKDLEKLYKAHVKGLFDVAAVHPFSGHPVNSVKIVRSNRRVMDRHGDRRKPIWLTELTWTSAKGKTKNVHNWETTEAGQAKRLTEGYGLYVKERRSLRLERIYWYTWAGYDSPPNSFDYSGLRHSSADGTFSDKPALNAFRAITKRYGR
jgi:hypothetical protein